MEPEHSDSRPELPQAGPPIVPGAVLLDSLTENKETVLDLVRAIGDETSKARTAKMRVSNQVSLLLFLFLAGIISASAFLVYTGRMSDGSFTFLLGVIVGYLMQFADKLLFKPQEE